MKQVRRSIMLSDDTAKRPGLTEGPVRTRMNVLLVCSDPMTTSSITHGLGLCHNIRSAPCRRAALAAYGRERPDVVLIDLCSSGADTKNIVGDIKILDPKAKIIVMTQRISSESMLMNLIETGATAVLRKSGSMAELDKAITWLGK